MPHIPVMLNEVLTELSLAKGMKVIDATLGGGGHSKAILDKIGPTGRLLGLDRDGRTLRQTCKALATYKNATLVQAEFDQLEAVSIKYDFTEVDAILFDLGFSSIQLDDPKRGFSYQVDSPLDMRLDQNANYTAADLINKSNEKTLADIFYRYGELYDAKRMAKQVIEARHRQPINSSQQLVSVLGLKNPGVLSKLFQALRIAVNDELNQLERVIPVAVSTLKEGGRIGIITFHSLEDRIVKRAFLANHRLKPLTKKPVIPTQAEITANRRSRSAKLRIAEKI